MALSYRATPASFQQAAGPTSYSITNPGSASGDWIFIYAGGGLISGWSITGFTFAGDAYGIGGILYRRADGTEGSSFSITGINTGRSIAGVIATVAGAASTLDPATVSPYADNTSETTFPVSSITLAGASDWVLWFAMNTASGAGFAITPPSGFTSRATNGAQASTGTAMIADKISFGSGATGSQAGTTGTAAFWSGVMVGVQPQLALSSGLLKASFP